MSGARKQIDWDAIEPHYRAGIRSLKDIGAEFEVSDAAIIKHAKRDGWVRQAKLERSSAPVLPDEFGRAGFVYVVFLVDSSGSRFCKIGMAAAFTPRFQAHQCASPFKIQVACAYYVGDMRMEERELHTRYASKRVRGEWFALNDHDIREIAARGCLV